MGNVLRKTLGHVEPISELNKLKLLQGSIFINKSYVFHDHGMRHKSLVKYPFTVFSVYFCIFLMRGMSTLKVHLISFQYLHPGRKK